MDVYELTTAGRVRKKWFNSELRKHVAVLVCAEKMVNDFEIETKRGILRGRAGDFLVLGTSPDSCYVFPQEMEALFRLRGSEPTLEELQTDPALATVNIERTLKGTLPVATA